MEAYVSVVLQCCYSVSWFSVSLFCLSYQIFIYDSVARPHNQIVGCFLGGFLCPVIYTFYPALITLNMTSITID